MKVLIIEDEMPAAKRLISLIHEIEPTWEILEIIDEVFNATNWFKQNDCPDLVFMDIQLADGFSFEIFRQVEIQCPVIFVTAFDQYAINAFRVQGLDYLLKPLQKEDLVTSIERYKSTSKSKEINLEFVSELIQQKQKSFKERFLIKSGEELSFVRTSEIAFFLSESSYSFVVTKAGNRYILDETMDQIESSLNPNLFFRINRKQLISIDAISKISVYFNHRLKLDLTPHEKEDAIVSRNRVKDFKHWLNR